MKIKNLFAAVAVATMTVVPVAANAGTVAGASLQGVKPVLSTEYRASRSVKKEQGIGAAAGVLSLLGVGATAFALTRIFRGTNASNG